MHKILLAAGAAALALTATQSFAAQHNGGPTIAGPAQPIPYSQLNAYLKASPKQRASRDRTAAASTGTMANTLRPIDGRADRRRRRERPASHGRGDRGQSARREPGAQRGPPQPAARRKAPKRRRGGSGGRPIA